MNIPCSLYIVQRNQQRSCTVLLAYDFWVSCLQYLTIVEQSTVLFAEKRLDWSRKCIRWLLEKKLMNLGYARGVQICCFWLYHLQSPDVLLLSYALYVNRSCWGRRPGHFDASDSCEASLKSTMLIRKGSKQQEVQVTSENKNKSGLPTIPIIE